MDYLDVTKKFRIKNLEMIVEKAADLDIPFVGIDHQVDTYFRTETGKLKWRNGNIEKLITHYDRLTAGNGVKTKVFRYDIDPDISEVEALFSYHEVIGKTKKKRRIFKSENIKLHFDELENGTCYVEIEAFSFDESNSENDLEMLCNRVCQQLGLDLQNQVPTGYFSSDA